MSIQNPLKEPLEQNNATVSSWCVYLLLCADNSYYCGITNNIQKRLRQHNGEIAGGAKYTHARRPCQLAYLEPADNRSHASQKEYQIKRLKASAKQRLCQQKVATDNNLIA